MLFSYSTLFLLAASIVNGRQYPHDAPLRKQNLVRGIYPLNARDFTEPQRAQAVIDAFNHAWSGYYKYAFPADELLSVSNKPGNSRNGWGASAVDALSTAIIMGQNSTVDIILNHIATINYASTNTTVSLFETTIRYLAGMLAGYDLLTGPFAGTTNNTNIPTLLTQAKNLANVLKFAFNTTTGIPYNGLNITAQSSTDTDNALAQVGTLALEWTRLSDLLNDTQYSELATKAENYLLNPQPSWAEPWPGLVGSNINITTGLFEDASGGWQGGDDSFYEYLIKTYVYDPSRFSNYKDRWVLAADSSIRYLASHPQPINGSTFSSGLTFLAEFKNQTLVLDSQHLACFDGGNFILGGLVLQNQTLVDFGLTLVDGCHQTYNSTATKIGPEQFSWNLTALPANQTDFYNDYGFFITDASYDLRPEVIESYYYAYRATGDSKYQDWAWDAFLAINATTYTDSGFTSVADINTPGGGNKTDLQESFLFAEVMKYSYIIHADLDAAWQVQNGTKQNFVINTEAHPLKVVGPAA